jgi:membrane associated rhomboid family serine protease
MPPGSGSGGGAIWNPSTGSGPPSVPGPTSPSGGAGPEYCYRHPDRETGRRCTRCGRSACSECLVQASVGSHCVECVKAAKPPAAVRARRWGATRSFPVTKAIIVVNVAVFVYLIAKDPNVLGGSQITQAQQDLGLNRIFIADGQIYRLLTAGFLHFGLIHIAFNMLALWNLGQMLEPITGPVEYGLFYLASLLAGSAGVLVLGGAGLTGGASGAVFGLFGAAAVALRQRGINPFRTSIGTVLILNLVLTFSIPGISIGGHVGGLIGGALCGMAVFAPQSKQIPKWAGYAVPVAVAIASVGISLAVSG